MRCLFALLLLLAAASAQLTPTPPSTPRLLNVSATSIEIGWVTSRIPSGGSIQRFDVAYRDLSSNQNSWMQIEDPMIGMKDRSVREVQRIRTRCNPGFKPMNGTFELTLNFNRITDLDVETVAITDFIPFDATAVQMKAALEALENVVEVDVSRGYESFTGHVDAPDRGMVPSSGGGYTWLVTFYYDRVLDKLPTADIPSLGLHKTSISCPGAEVEVSEIVKGSRQRAVCTRDCHLSVKGLTPSTRYSFRVRAQNQHGWGDYSKPSSAFSTVLQLLPGNPRPPRVSSSTSDSISLTLSASEADSRGALLAFGLQYSVASSKDWQACTPSVCRFVPTATGAYFALRAGDYEAFAVVSGLDSAATYEFRLRLRNKHGLGSWSDGVLGSTKAGAPSTMDAPLVQSARSNRVDLVWAKPPGNGAALITYSVEKQLIVPHQENPWVKALPDVDAREGLDQAERQTITIKVPHKASITGGHFVLAFNYGSTSDRDPETHTRTNGIPFDATADVVRRELEALENIQRLHRVLRSQVNPRGGGSGLYRWTITFDPTTHKGDLPSLIEVYNTLRSDAADGSAYITISETVKGTTSKPRKQVQATVANLQPHSKYNFRVRAVNAKGVGRWSAPSEFVRTHAAPFPAQQKRHPTHASVPLLHASKDRFPAALTDPDYVHGAGEGGLPEQNGADGVVVIIAYAYSQKLIWGERENVQTTMGKYGKLETIRTTFFYAHANDDGQAQTYTVPRSTMENYRVKSVHIKAWGAGGGGGRNKTVDIAVGGGGGFASAHFAVVEGERLTVVVGGGGRGFSTNVGAAGGYNGGGAGGDGEFGGAGGGGASEIKRQDGTVLLIAGGGGGAGNTDYCCAHGGGGGGTSGFAGRAPVDTPRDIARQGGTEQYRFAGAVEWGQNTGRAAIEACNPRTDAAGINAAMDLACATRYPGSVAMTKEQVYSREFVLDFPKTFSYDLLPECALTDKGYHLGTRENTAGARHCKEPGAWPNSDKDWKAECSTCGSLGCILCAHPPVEYNDFYDSRDAVGFPPDHQHLEHGFAPEASLLVLTTGGAGGSQGAAGGAGLAGSYKHGAYTMFYAGSRALDSPKSIGATPGTQRFGGRGGFGKEGGGGGGGGYFGGGGGGSGVDGAGGGGGSGFVNSLELYEHRDVPLTVRPAAMSVPVLETVDYANLTLSWSPPATLPGSEVISYVIEMAVDSASMAFYQVAQPGRYTTSWQFTGLHEESVYRFRIAAASARGGLGDFSPALRVSTLARPRDRWTRVIPYSAKFSRGGMSDTSEFLQHPDAPTHLRPRYPSPRRGHTMVIIDSGVFVFGGYSRGYSCDRGETSYCRQGEVSGRKSYMDKTGVTRGGGPTNEVWRLDPKTYTWTLIKVVGDKGIPAGRERHSAVVIGDEMFIHGGRDDYAHDNGFNDIWNFNFGHHTTVKRTNDNPASVRDGRNTFSRIVINEDGHFASSKYSKVHQQCVRDVNVRVHLKHECLRDVSVWLISNGPVLAGSTWRKSTGAQDRAVQLFRGDWTSSRGCGGGGLEGTTFDDESKVDFRECCPETFEGTYRPLEPLRSFDGVTLSGNWTLHIQDSAVNEQEGLLQSWSIEFDVKECDYEYRWTELPSTNTSFKVPDEKTQPNWKSRDIRQRYDHTAVVVQRNMYIWGGLICCVFEYKSGDAKTNPYKNKQGEDLWRYNVDDEKWVYLRPIQYTPSNYRLDPDYIPPTRYGRSIFVSPFGVLAFAGLTDVWKRQRFSNNLWYWNTLLDEWSVYNDIDPPELDVASHRNRSDFLRLHDYASGRDVHYRKADVAINAPTPRYYHAAVMLDFPPETGTIMGDHATFRMIMFGGDDGSQYLDDLWEFRLRNMTLSTHSADAQRRDVCSWRTLTEGTAWRHWLSTCVDQTDTSTCGLPDIVNMAWCLQENQVIYNW